MSDDAVPEGSTKTALVTGGAQGIGRAVARRLAGEGMAVLIADIQDDKGESVASEIVSSGHRAAYVHADVGEPSDAREMVERSVAEYGRLDVLVNNAFENIPGTAEEVASADWDRGFGVMVRAMGLAARAAIPEMRRVGGGSIVNISSVHGLLAAERSVIYETCKAAVIGLTRALALDYGPDRVRVNAICPGAIVTEVTDPDFQADRARARLTEAIYPLRRVGRPDDIAAAVSFLVSEEAAFITANTLVVDGGLSAQLQDGLASRVKAHLAARDDGRPLRTPSLGG